MKSKIKNLFLCFFSIGLLLGIISILNQRILADSSGNISSPEDISETSSTPAKPPASKPPTLPPSTPSTPPPPHTPHSPVPSPSSTTSPSPLPSPSSTPEVCTYISGSLNDKGTKHGKYVGNTFEKYGDKSKFACIDRLISQVKASAKDWHQYWNDDSYANALAKIVFPDTHGKSQKVGVHSNGAICHRLYDGDVPGGRNFCGVGQFFMDANTCKIISIPKGSECARFELNYFKGCPVSLIWDEGAEVGASNAIVQFSLGNNAADWTIWKGSEKTPLLVYDPNHTGTIETAQQLFGEWTFGGKKVAALSKYNNKKIRNNSVFTTPWRDGFEALSVLDKNKNGKIEGRELAVLALWFDKNQDAISQVGEVIDIRKLGVKALYFKLGKKQAGGDIIMTKGFERVVAGKTVIGKSVDWYSVTSESPLDLLNLQTMHSTIENISIEQNQYASSEVGNDEDLSGAPSKFSGLWKWHIRSPGKISEQSGGYLTFKRADIDGNLFGFSLTERELAISPSTEVQTGGGLFALQGFQTEVNGKDKITFKSEFNGNTLHSKAFLSNDGRIMRGKTLVNGSSRGEKVELTYHWIAFKQDL